MYGVTWPSFSAAAAVFSHSTCQAGLTSAAKPAAPLNRRTQRQIVSRMVLYHCMRCPTRTTTSLASAALGHRIRRVALGTEANDLVFLRIAIDTDRVRAVLHRPDLIAQQFAEQNDAAVGLAEVLVGTIGDRPLRLPGHLVLTGKTFHVKFARLILGADELRRRIFGNFDAVSGWIEPHVKDLSILIVDRRAKMHVVAVGGGDHQHIRKDERMGRFDVAGVVGKDPLFLNPRPGRM